MTSTPTIPERIAILEAEARDVVSRLQRIERIVWGLVALQLGLKYLL